MDKSHYSLSRKIRWGRSIFRSVFLICITYWFFQEWFIKITQEHSSSEIFSFLHTLAILLILFLAIDLVIGYLNRILSESITSIEEKAVGTVLTFNNKITVTELSTKLGLKENELEEMFAHINIKGEYFVNIDKETRNVSVGSVESLIGKGTVDEKLQKLETLLKEGKISEKTYKTLKEKYLKEKEESTIS